MLLVAIRCLLLMRSHRALYVEDGEEVPRIRLQEWQVAARSAEFFDPLEIPSGDTFARTLPCCSRSSLYVVTFW